MNSEASFPVYEASLVTALQRIQAQYGYLNREALERYSKESSIPLPRLHAVASFFPHFQLSPPKQVVVKICRDMSCAMAGSCTTIKNLQASMEGKDVSVEGVSCLGRCDRAPAAMVTVGASEHAHSYLGRSEQELKEIITSCLRGNVPHSDHDAATPSPLEGSVIDFYAQGVAPYSAVQKALACRDASLTKAMQVLQETKNWPTGRAEQFRLAAVNQLRGLGEIEDEVADAVRAWQTESDWAKGRDLGGWAEAIFDEIKAADLRGMGGAGIPSGQKLRDVRDGIRTARKRMADDRGFIVVNGDESEPGTFKDRELLLRTPHLIVEAVILAGLVTEATQGFIYIRHEYTEQIEACRAEIKRAEELGLCGMKAAMLGRPFPLSVFVSPGGYICGEQSALIEAMSDRRGEPRNMPPKLESNGLDDMPTIVSNVETYAWMPYIFVNGGKTYAEQGVNGWQGRRVFSISGDVNRPGVYEVPMGLTLRELVYGDQYCQGIVGGRKLKAFAPSGPSGGFLPAKLTATNGLPRNIATNKSWIALAGRRGFDPATTTELDILDLELELNLFRALSPTQALGAGLVVYAEGRNMVAEAVNSLEFFRNESCGKCVPCRLGSQKLAALGGHILAGQVSAERWENEMEPLVEEMSRAIELASICGLGRSVPVPLRTVSRFLPEDLTQCLSGTPAVPKPNGSTHASNT